MTREEAIRHIRDMIAENNSIKPNIVIFEQEKEALYMAIEALSERPKGKWINSKTAKGYVACSNCNKLTTNINRKKYNYCPFCGTRMKGEVM